MVPDNIEYKLTCLYGCGHASTAGSHEGIGVLTMEHTDNEHGTPVGPLEAGELALKRFDDTSLRQARQ